MDVPTNFAFSGFNAPFLSYTKEEFFPFIDKYGQFKHKDWTDKIKSDGDFKKRAEEEKAFYEKIGGISGRDKYLGLVRDGKNYGATGRFRAEKIDGRQPLLFVRHNVRRQPRHDAAHRPRILLRGRVGQPVPQKERIRAALL